MVLGCPGRSRPREWRKVEGKECVHGVGREDRERGKEEQRAGQRDLRCLTFEEGGHKPRDRGDSNMLGKRGNRSPPELLAKRQPCQFILGAVTSRTPR